MGTTILSMSEFRVETMRQYYVPSIPQELITLFGSHYPPVLLYIHTFYQHVCMKKLSAQPREPLSQNEKLSKTVHHTVNDTHQCVIIMQ